VRLQAQSRPASRARKPPNGGNRTYQHEFQWALKIPHGSGRGKCSFCIGSTPCACTHGPVGRYSYYSYFFYYYYYYNNNY